MTVSTKNIRTVHFMAAQGCEDLYRCRENGMVYIRQECGKEHVRWLTACKWSGGYEADCPMKAGLDIRVVDGFGNELFVETIVRENSTGDTWAKKVGEFSSEAIRRVCKEVTEKLTLKSHEEWKAWLMEDMERSGYSGYTDNWLYVGVRYRNRKTLFTSSYLGKPVLVTATPCQHKICGKEWQCIEILPESKLFILELCGYLF